MQEDLLCQRRIGEAFKQQLRSLEEIFYKFWWISRNCFRTTEYIIFQGLEICLEFNYDKFNYSTKAYIIETVLPTVVII